MSYFILEIQRFDNESWMHYPFPSKWIHVGFQDEAFKTESDAEDWYARRFPHMRRIRDKCSDWDPKNNKWRYVIVAGTGVDRNIERKIVAESDIHRDKDGNVCAIMKSYDFWTAKKDHK